MNDTPSNPLIHSSVSGGLDILQMYADALSKDYEQDTLKQGGGFGSHRDIQAIQSQEFDGGPGFNAGTIGAGVGAGAALGPWGMVAGGVLGTGAELIKHIRRKNAERKFNYEKSLDLKDARHVNMSRNYRGNMIKNLGVSSNKLQSDYNRFL